MNQPNAQAEAFETPRGNRVVFAAPGYWYAYYFGFYFADQGAPGD